MTYSQETILAELIKEGYKARISTTGWLLVSGLRTDWKEAFNMAFLGWKREWNQPKIVKVA